MQVEEIIESVDILEYISQFCELEERQDGEYWGLSPLKDENTPSFSVNVEKQRFYDFSSGKYGDVLAFIREYYRCGFHKSMEILKEYAKIEDATGDEVVKRLDATSIAKKYKKRTERKKESSGVLLPDDYMNRYEWNERKLQVWLDEGITAETMRKF